MRVGVGVGGGSGGGGGGRGSLESLDWTFLLPPSLDLFPVIAIFEIYAHLVITFPIIFLTRQFRFPHISHILYLSNLFIKKLEERAFKEPEYCFIDLLQKK